MKQTENNEMDLLLRGLARREGGSSVVRDGATQDQAATAHLDGDELSSYAEGALPALARARYTAHLADCSRCRKIVSQLALSSGASIQPSTIEPQTSIGFWERVSALLSPQVLRYAVPALALFAVIAVSLFALRQQPQPEFVAQTQPSTPPSKTEDLRADSPTETKSNSGLAPTDSARDKSQDSDIAGADKRAMAREESLASPPASPADALSAAPRKDAPREQVAATPTFAPEPGAAPPPKPQTASVETNTGEVAQRKEKSPERDAAAREQQEQEGARAKAEDRENKQALAKSRNTSPSGDFSSMRTGQVGSAAGKKADDEAEMRSVSGRRFRRQGGVWIDTAYQSSVSAITVARGTEQYLALVADEPGIRAIAEQLPGEIVLVWKGRTYRIR